MNLEEVSNIAMEIISYAGCAKSCYMNALQHYKKGKDKAGNDCIAEGDKAMLVAHKSHASLLSVEMNQQEPQASLLLMHAEDQLMHAETIKILAEELKDVYATGGKNNE